MSKIAGMYILLTKKGPLFLADTTVNISPTAEELADITLLVAKEVRNFNMEPRVAMLSYSNFGSSDTPEARKMAEATRIVKQKNPNLIVDGEMQADTAVVPEIIDERYPFSQVKDANVLVFPSLEAANIAYKLLQELGGAEAVGPILLGLKKPVHIVQLGSSVREIVNMVTIAVLDVQGKEEAANPKRKGILNKLVKK